MFGKWISEEYAHVNLTSTCSDAPKLRNGTLLRWCIRKYIQIHTMTLTLIKKCPTPPDPHLPGRWYHTKNGSHLCWER